MHFFSLSMTRKKNYSLNSKREWFVQYRGQKCVRGFYYILHLAAYVQREQERERGNEATQLPENQDVANNICSPFQRQGAYTHIGYSL